MNFEFATAGRIVFGSGSAAKLPSLARELGGRRALVVLGGSERGREALTAGLAEVGIASVVVAVGGEPTTDRVDEATHLARAEGVDLVIARGGGSVLDAGKAVAALIGNPGAVLDYLELVGKGRPLERPGVPFVAVPTTAGTGTEVTRNAVLDVPEHKVKASLRGQYLLPRLAVIDPELTVSMPPDITAFTGMDALTQLIEPFVGNMANPITDGVCREGLVRVARSLSTAYRDGSDVAAREDMALAALCGGIALANARLGAVHGFAGVLGGATGHAHGAICARLLPIVMEANLRAIAERGDPAILDRYAEVARTLTGDPEASALDGAAWVRSRCEEFRIPGLGQAGLTVGDCDRIIPVARRASSMKGNPLPLTDEELRSILDAAI
ncbi:iron-containing alcohol dehydrogenase [Tautonia sp. JC769]|uniref:iron-containing alcohol dehydrogenase n=1 Tax=Tautonia sp. JC769 TaxID=3232135 RepID=UPI003459D58F